MASSAAYVATIGPSSVPTHPQLVATIPVGSGPWQPPVMANVEAVLNYRDETVALLDAET